MLTAADGAKLPARLWLRIVAPFAAGYFVSYLFRTINAVISPDLARDFNLDAADLGLLTSAYFASFALFQIPLGILLDRYGARRVEALLLLVAATGALVFAFSGSQSGLIAGRALIGLGVSACLMAAFKAFASRFSGERLPMVNGIVLAAGGFGAAFASAPVEAALRIVDWRTLFMILSCVTLAVAAVIFFVVPERQARRSSEGLRAQLAGVAFILRQRNFWQAAPLALAQGAFLSIHGLWSGPWLIDIAGLARSDVAFHLLLTAIGMICGFLGIGALALRLGRIGVAPLSVGKVNMAIFMLIQLMLALGVTSATALTWIAFGIFGAANSLSYAVVSQRFPPAFAGRLNTTLNLLAFVFAFSLQWSMGALLDLAPKAGGGYTLAGYGAAFGMALVLQTAAFIWLMTQRSPPRGAGAGCGG